MSLGEYRLLRGLHAHQSQSQHCHHTFVTGCYGRITQLKRCALMQQQVVCNAHG